MTYVAIVDRDIESTFREFPASHRSEDGWGVSVPARYRAAAVRQAHSLLAETQPNEPVIFDEAGSVDLAVFPGKAASPMVREAQKTRSVLCKLINKFYEEGFSWQVDDCMSISASSRDAATRMIDLLPDNCVSPQIAPDGEGAVIFHFGDEGRDDLVIVEGWTVHVVANAARAGARYHDNLPFDGSALPPQVLELLVAH